MLPYLVLGGVALGALAFGSKKRTRRSDPRTAATQRLRIIDSRHAVTRRMMKANPGSRFVMKKNRETGEWMVRGYVAGQQRPAFTTWHKTKADAARELASLKAWGKLVIAKRKSTLNNPKGLIGVDSEGIRWSVKKNAETKEWMIVAYVNGKRNEDKTSYHDDKDDAVGTFQYLMSTRGGRITNPPQLAGTCPKCGRPKAASAVRGEKPDRHLCYSAVYGSCLLGRHGRMRANPDWRGEVPAGYKSRAARRLAKELKNGANPVHALEVARIVARQGGDHIALAAINAVHAELTSSPKMTLREGENRAREVAMALGSGGFHINPPRRKRRKAKKAKRGKKAAPKHFVRTTTHTVKTVQQNPGKRKFRVFIGNSRHSEYVDVKASSEAEAFKEARRVDWLAALPQNRDRLTIFK